MENTKKSVRKKKSNFEKYNRFGYYFLIPFFVGFLLFTLYPMIYSIAISFTSMNGWQSFSDATNVGLQNFITLLTSTPLFMKALGNSVMLWIFTFIPQVLLALILAAWWTNRKLNLKGSGFFKTVFYLPNMIMAASIAALFGGIFGYPTGLANLLLQNLHLINHPFNFFQSVWGTRGIVIFIQFWIWYGQIFRRITLPLLRPIVLYTFVTSFIGGLQVFDIPFIMTQGGPQNGVYTLSIFIYNQAFAYRNYGLASAASVLLLIISAVVSILMFRGFRERVNIGGEE